MAAEAADEEGDDEETSAEYRAITRQLHALSSGEQHAGGAGLDDSAAAAAEASPSSRLFNRTLGMFGWGGAAVPAGGAGEAAAAMHAQVGLDDTLSKHAGPSDS